METKWHKEREEPDRGLVTKKRSRIKYQTRQQDAKDRGEQRLEDNTRAGT